MPNPSKVEIVTFSFPFASIRQLRFTLTVLHLGVEIPQPLFAVTQIVADDADDVLKSTIISLVPCPDDIKAPPVTVQV